MGMRRFAIGLIGPGRDGSVDEATAKCVAQGLVLLWRSHAVCLEPQSVHLRGARFGDREIVVRYAEGCLICVPVPPEAQRKCWLGDHGCSDQGMIQQGEREWTRQAIADEADTLPCMPVFNRLDHTAQPVHDRRASMGGRSPFPTGEKVNSAPKPVGLQSMNQ